MSNVIPDINQMLQSLPNADATPLSLPQFIITVVLVDPTGDFHDYLYIIPVAPGKDQVMDADDYIAALQTAALAAAESMKSYDWAALTLGGSTGWTAESVTLTTCAEADTVTAI